MSAAIELQVLSALRRLIRATDLASKQLARETHLSMSQLLVMELLAEKPEQTVGSIAERVGLAQTTVTSLIDKLESRGLVRRTRSNADRRQVIVSLTEGGRALSGEAPTALQTTFLTNFEGLKDWEKTAILSSLERLADLMEARDLDAWPVLEVGSID
jgi:DNA-binding MarR family transcriptional regulator